MKSLQKYKKRLEKVEKELDKCRTSSFIDGWQTQRHAKKARKWDELAKEKMELINIIDTVENCKRDKHNDDIFNFGECLECESRINTN